MTKIGTLCGCMCNSLAIVSTFLSEQILDENRRERWAPSLWLVLTNSKTDDKKKSEGLTDSVYNNGNVLEVNTCFVREPDSLI